LIGTDGNRAAASNETILSFGSNFKFLTVSTKSEEFLQTYGLFSINGFRISFRREARDSWGAPIWEVIRRAGKSFWGLWAFMAGLAVGVREPEG
jgi:hypothetical protein